MWVQNTVFHIAAAAVVLTAAACRNQPRAEPPPANGPKIDSPIPGRDGQKEPPMATVRVEREVAIGGFFEFLDKVVRESPAPPGVRLTENLLLRANPWLLDSLMASDYYHQISLGNFVFDQKRWAVLRSGDSLAVPGPRAAAALLERMGKTRIDVNIPAFELRILEGDSLLFSMPVRVGKDQKKHLELAGHTVDLRTRTGRGRIIRVERDPLFLDPVTGKKFKFTRRDDRRTTLMPRIPWLETELDGRRYGQMLHPTTNPRTLGRAASNGCIGVGEADGWRLYFFAPVGTPVTVRYDLMEIRPGGDTARFDDIYHLRRTAKQAGFDDEPGLFPQKTQGLCLCDSLF